MPLVLFSYNLLLPLFAVAIFSLDIFGIFDYQSFILWVQNPITLAFILIFALANSSQYYKTTEIVMDGIDKVNEKLEEYQENEF